jgi:site-specific DNA-methyltransferase (adenine-specific)
MPKRRPGVIRDAILSHLSGIDRDASVAEITRAVEARLGAPVAPSSVRSYLRLADDLLTRTARGRYRLRPPEAAVVREDATAASGGNGSRPAPAGAHGAATLFQDDCIAWLGRQAPNSLHAVVTDPPYGLVEYSGAEQSKLRAGRGGVWRIPPSFDGHRRAPVPRFTVLSERDLVRLEAFFTEWARALYPVLVPGANVLVASNPLVSYRVAAAVTRAGFERRGEIVRRVMTMRGGDRPKNAHEEFRDVSVMPRSMWEPWLTFRKPLDGRVQDNLRRWRVGGFRRISADRPFGDVIESRPTRPEERAIANHPSLKPQAFLRQVVRAALPLGEGIVLDPFAGSGSTLAAAEAVGYRSIGVEIDPAYVDVARTAIPRLAALRPSG